MEDDFDVSWTYYERSTGIIVGTFSGSLMDADANRPEGCEHVEGFCDGRTHWVVDDQPVPRPETPLPVVNGNLVTFPDLPADTRIRLTNEQGDVIEFTLEEAEGDVILTDIGTYQCVIMAKHPYHYVATSFELLTLDPPVYPESPPLSF